MLALPPSATIQDVVSQLSALADAFQQHSEWKPTDPPTDPPMALYDIWGFVCRTRYIASELENIRDGKPLKHPEQIPDGNISGKSAAQEVYGDVLTRTFTANQLINTPMMLSMMGLQTVDFGEDIRTKSKAALDAVK